MVDKAMHARASAHDKSQEEAVPASKGETPRSRIGQVSQGAEAGSRKRLGGIVAQGAGKVCFQARISTHRKRPANV